MMRVNVIADAFSFSPQKPQKNPACNLRLAASRNRFGKSRPMWPSSTFAYMNRMPQVLKLRCA
jgi:hypothetical protein